MKYSQLFNYTNTWVFMMILISSIIDIFVVKSYIDVIELLLVIGWIYMLKVSSAAKIFSVPIILLYVILIPVCLTFSNDLSAQKLSIWVFYIFFMYLINKSISLYKIK